MFPVKQKSPGIHNIMKLPRYGLCLFERLIRRLLIGMQTKHNLLEVFGNFFIGAIAVFHA